MNKNKRKKRSNPLLIVLAVVLSVVTVAVVTVCVLYMMNVGKPQKPEVKKEIEEPHPEQEEEPVLTEEELFQKKVEETLEQLTLEEKVAQMFVVTPESLTGVELAIAAGDVTKEAINEYPVGGIIYFAQNLENPDQVKEMLANTQSYAMERIGLPILLGVDEEGGTVSRISGNPAFGIGAIQNMCDIGATGDPQNAYQIGVQIGTYLKELGFNLDYAPDADVLTNPENTVVQYRSFGTDCNLVADMALSELNGLKEQDVIGVLKHFPGHGATAGDTHEGYAYTNATLEEMKNNELVPFIRGVESDVDMIMVAHISCPNVTGADTPASMSERMVNGILRGELGYNGLVTTDGMGMGAISQNFPADQAAIQAIQAGVDFVLMPADFKAAYQGVLQAVRGGIISEERIDESLRRILNLKLQM